MGFTLGMIPWDRRRAGKSCLTTDTSGYKKSLPVKNGEAQARATALPLIRPEMSARKTECVKACKGFLSIVRLRNLTVYSWFQR